MAQALQQFGDIWKKLGINQKATILFMLVGVLAGIGVLVHLSRRPSYELLYSDLEEKDMATVASYLKESNIPYRVTNGGRTILVAEGTKYDARLGLANKGTIPGGRAGLEIVQPSGWATSPMAEQMLKRRAIQGELSRTIMHIEQIAWADVQIAQPEPTPFAEEQKPTTAAISLKTRPGTTLTLSQVAGISRLVAGAVEGLEPQNVTIIDERGNLLSTPTSDTVGAEASDRQDYRRAYENYLASKAQALLDRALGPGRSVVKVSAVLDMDRISETKEAYDVDNKVARTEKMVSRTTTGDGGASGGTSSTEEESHTDYEVPKSVRTVQSAPGSVTHLDVAVIIDPTYTDAEGTEKSLPEEDITKLVDLVKGAVGLVEAAPRNDTIQRAAMTFRKAPPPSADPAPEDHGKRQYYLQIAKYGSSVLSVIIFAVFVSIVFKRTARKARAAAAEGGGAAGPSPMMATTLLTMPKSATGNGHAKVRNRVKDIIAGDPFTAARLLQRWISEEDAA